MTSSSELITSARARFNTAIAEKDSATIRTLLAPTYHIVTGRSDQFHGQDEEAQRWSDLFISDPAAIYRRTAREITVNEAWGIAEELGRWQGEYMLNKKLVRASGVYAAKWQRTITGTWVLQVEVFTTINFDEDCIPPDLL